MLWFLFGMGGSVSSSARIASLDRTLVFKPRESVLWVLLGTGGTVMQSAKIWILARKLVFRPRESVRRCRARFEIVDPRSRVVAHVDCDEFYGSRLVQTAL